MSADGAHPAAQVSPLHTSASGFVPSAQALHPLLLCRVAKNNPADGAAPEHPVGERSFTSADVLQTWNPTAQRSVGLHPVPDGLELLLPAIRPHSAVAEKRMPGTDQPPEQAAIFGYRAASRNPSRVPSLHPGAQPSSTMPLQSLSTPSQTSGKQVVVDVVLVDVVLVVDVVVVVPVVEVVLVEVVVPVVVEVVDVVPVVPVVDVVPPSPPVLLEVVEPPAPAAASSSALLVPQAARRQAGSSIDQLAGRGGRGGVIVFPRRIA